VIGASTQISRDINVYIPESVKQNTLRRKMNVLVANDGSITEVSQYVASGFEVALNNGHIPESIIVGIPQFSADCNRQYELFFEQCDSIGKWKKYDRGTNPATSSYYYGCPGNVYSVCPPRTPANGTDYYLTWIYNSVLPAVMKEINMTLGEVSIVGGSFGGLCACYAPSRFPNWFSRGFCYAPSVMMNYASIADKVRSNYAESKMLPKSIIMEVGHEAYDIFINLQTNETVMKYYFFHEMKHTDA
jgi:enterochelin esterase-like enzyme